MYQDFNSYSSLYREGNYEYDDCLDNEYRATDYSFYVWKTITAPANTSYFSIGTPIFIRRTFGHGQNQNVEVIYQSPFGLRTVIISAIELDGSIVSCPTQNRPTLRKGSTGYWVVKLQGFLQKIGYYSGRIDGQFGHILDGSVSNYQRDHRLIINGIVGPKTWCQLERDGFSGGSGVIP
uniref:Putative peptidoglycan binding protein n=1 Tax=Bacillus thuringiensis TaxID=1428 RepID=B0FXR8_BACTU|nr:peptidoglycan-binding protein [Bacillus thuringiensis]ABY68467.1 putative peptidoglycan binding protein [Bacillus thuringiensis]